MATPISDEAMKTGWPAYVKAMEERMEAGKEAYGDGSFLTPVLSGLCEVQAELIDQGNWSFIQWYKIELLKRKVAGL